MAPRLRLDPGPFAAHFGHKGFKVGHDLGQHPLFELPRLLELGRALPADRVEYNAGNLPVEQDPGKTPRNGLSVEETIRRIEACGSWMVLKNIERDSAYRSLLEECLDEVKPLSEPIDPGMRNLAGFIFLSSPGSVTPFHMDPEYNFLLQVRGSKTVHMWDPEDRSVLAETALEQYFGTLSGHRNLPYHERYARTAWVFELEPGEGLHLPYAAPHWVKNGDAVSVSFSITFQTPRTLDRNLAYTINARLRSAGLKPRPVGESPLRDSAVRYGYNVFQAARRLLKAGRDPRPSERKY